MERKAKMYERLKRGEEVPDRIRDELLVEFEYGYEGRGRGRRSGQRRGSDSRSDYSEDDGSNQSRSRSRSLDSHDWDRDESKALARDPRDYKVTKRMKKDEDYRRTLNSELKIN